MKTLKSGQNRIRLNVNECESCNDYAILFTQKSFPCTQEPVEQYDIEDCEYATFLIFNLPAGLMSCQYDLKIWCIGNYSEQRLIFDETVIIKSLICQF